MGLLDDLVNLPGKIVKTAVETTVRIPEAGIKTVSGALDGLESGLEKLSETLDDEED